VINEEFFDIFDKQIEKERFSIETVEDKVLKHYKYHESRLL